MQPREAVYPPATLPFLARINLVTLSFSLLRCITSLLVNKIRDVYNYETMYKAMYESTFVVTRVGPFTELVYSSTAFT